MGAFYAIVGKVSPFSVTRNKDICINCHRCTENCPVNIDVSHSKKITSAECINCQTCVLNCPTPGALDLKVGKVTVRPLIAILLVLTLFFAPIVVTSYLGIYKVRNEGIRSGQTISISEVRGYMTIREAAEATKIEIKEFYKIFLIPQSVTDDTKMKEIGNKVDGYDFHKIKDGGK